MSVSAGTRATLREQAIAVLHGNDAGDWTRAAPVLYPHQWSWDSAFIAIGWAHVDAARAMTELEQLFTAQWATGMVPHVVFRAGPEHPYFPGPEWWDTSVSPSAPAAPLQTTGICQPPVHALALQRIWQLTPPEQQPEIRARVQALYPRMVSWHRYLATQRDPEASGLVTTFHPWEGTDNSPRWDRALERITVAKPGPYTRLDGNAVPDASQRPTNWDYDRFLWLVEQLRKYRYDDAQVYREYPFLIKDVFFSAVLVAANAALLDLADVAGASGEAREQLASWLDRGRAGLAGRFDAENRALLGLRRPDRRRHQVADVRGVRAAVRSHPGPRPARRAVADSRLRGLLRAPGAALAPAAEHVARRAGVPAAQLLARTGLAGHQLAAVAVPRPARLPRLGGRRPRRLARPARGRGVRRVLRAVHR